MDKHYHIAVFAWRDNGTAIKSASIKVSPDENVGVGVAQFAYIFFPVADGWHHHGWDYGRIADDIIALERSVANDPAYIHEAQGVKARVLTNE